ncbi:hypothetical protein Q8A67_014073 [Cirrhinus molitorella]|uniref:Uncharacterized protein n=1 Tax=Cirrhinus molitorella TaxID=172907 RepID=A0AA88PJQ7_9TELE|nr:hypothetical protein Q8A67_014073 [Cirrhinus molitorella]
MPRCIVVAVRGACAQRSSIFPSRAQKSSGCIEPLLLRFGRGDTFECKSAARVFPARTRAGTMNLRELPLNGPR